MNEGTKPGAVSASSVDDHEYFSDHRGTGPSYGDPSPSGEHWEPDPVNAFLSECQKFVNLRRTESLLPRSIDSLGDELLSEHTQQILDSQSNRFRIRNSLQSLQDDVATEVIKIGRDPAPIYAIVMSAEQDASKFFEHWRTVNPLLKTVSLIMNNQPSGEPTRSNQGKVATGESAEPLTPIDQLQPAHRRAYLAFQYAAVKLERTPEGLRDLEAWDYIDENGVEGAGDLDDYALPLPDTFADYLNRARRMLGEPKKRPRTARMGKSTPRQSEV